MTHDFKMPVLAAAKLAHADGFAFIAPFQSRKKSLRTARFIVCIAVYGAGTVAECYAQTFNEALEMMAEAAADRSYAQHRRTAA